MTMVGMIVVAVKTMLASGGSWDELAVCDGRTGGTGVGWGPGIGQDTGFWAGLSACWCSIFGTECDAVSGAGSVALCGITCTGEGSNDCSAVVELSTSVTICASTIVSTNDCIAESTISLTRVVDGVSCAACASSTGSASCTGTIASDDRSDGCTTRSLKGFVIATTAIAMRSPSC